MQNYPVGKALIWYPVFFGLESNLPKGPGYEKISTLYRSKGIRFNTGA